MQVLVSTAALAALVFAGCACAEGHNAGQVPPAAMSRVEAACAMVARLPSGSVYDRDVCEESLSRALAAYPRPGTGLVAGPRRHAAACPRPQAIALADHAPLRERERRACLAIGLADEGLGQCMADLDAELAAARRPIM